MSCRSDLLGSELFQSSLWGTLRAIAVATTIHPLDVVKIQLQCTNGSEKCWHVAKQLFREKGCGAFYRGLSSQLIRASVKQAWCWPLITQLPPLLETYSIKSYPQQIITGLFIATVDAMVTTPLERAKILSVLAKKSTFSLTHIYQKGWHGFTAYWAKRTINMATFLTAQQYFRESNRKQNEDLKFLALLKTGTQVALTVSLVGAPFDMVNTLRQAHNLGFSHIISRSGLARIFRGWPLYATSLIVHNMASVLVMEKVTRK